MRCVAAVVVSPEVVLVVPVASVLAVELLADVVSVALLVASLRWWP